MQPAPALAVQARQRRGEVGVVLGLAVARLEQELHVRRDVRRAADRDRLVHAQPHARIAPEHPVAVVDLGHHQVEPPVDIARAPAPDVVLAGVEPLAAPGRELAARGDAAVPALQHQRLEHQAQLVARDRDVEIVVAAGQRFEEHVDRPAAADRPPERYALEQLGGVGRGDRIPRAEAVLGLRHGVHPRQPIELLVPHGTIIGDRPPKTGATC
jgi:hypothetical protein